MGSSTSVVSATSITNELLSVISNTVANAGQNISNANALNVSGNCKIVDTQIDQEIFVKVTADVLQQITSSVTAEQALSNQVKQTSDAAASALGIFGTAKAIDLTKLVSNLSTAIQNNISAACAQSGANSNVITCSGDASITGSWIKQSFVGTYLFNCTQKIASITDAKQQIQNFIDQNAKSSSTFTGSTLTSVILLIVCLVVSSIGVYVFKKLYT